MKIELTIKDFCDSTDLINQIKSQAAISNCNITFPNLQVKGSGHSDGKVTKKSTFKLYIIATTFLTILEFLEPIQPYLTELLKKDPRQEITIKSESINVEIKTDQDITKILESIKEILENKKNKPIIMLNNISNDHIF
ncbi:Aminoacyl-tRNA synthetase class Ia [Candidatus Scalindua japonica]|uniref:Aminoacyl-tRNA synthetase class Ia n=1 Tax=Candidatus Scalindua japonica TaxID=1284222 RepID=A0A286TYG7_9BACT|nr:hypothetical protein [Candidatus Scalindua japonica]GAX60927.1 Aminoacyl-tRNA synthetase class Ia [Candidatus Scalindua japonica]